MESRIKGYKLVPELEITENCDGCVFNDRNKLWCDTLKQNTDCIIFDAIYVPSDTSIEVPKHEESNKV